MCIRDRLQRAAGERGSVLTPVPNSRLTALLGDTVRVTMGEERYLSGADFALFWDKDIRLEMCIRDSFGAEARHVLSKSVCLSADVNAGFDPVYPEVLEPRNLSLIHI